MTAEELKVKLQGAADELGVLKAEVNKLNTLGASTIAEMASHLEIAWCQVHWALDRLNETSPEKSNT